MEQTSRERKGVAVLLAWVAGFVDGVGYLVLWKMFTSHMSGNTIAGSVHLGCEQWSEALHRLFPIPVFIAGVASGRALAVLLRRTGVRSVFAWSFLAEGLLLLTLFLIGGAPRFHPGGIQPDNSVVFYLLAALLPLTMGVQNATLRHAGGETVRTTYITGGLTDMTEEVVDYFCWLFDGAKQEATGSDPKKRPSLARAGMLLIVWLGYLFGGSMGAAEQRWKLPCLLVPIGCLLLLGLADLVSPFATPDESGANVAG